MTTIVVRLMAAELHYRKGLRLHTAASGPIDTLHEIYLCVERDGRVVGCGEMRTNIAYLTGVQEDRLVMHARQAVQRIDWRAEPEELVTALPTLLANVPPAVRALFDCALHDTASRRDGKPLAEWLGGVFVGATPTNQTLSWGGDAQLEQQAREYVARGFQCLKLRVGVAPFARDLERIARLRTALGSEVELALDANGLWSEDDALDNLRALEPFDIRYVEQPLAPGNWPAVSRLSQSAAIPIMLDESINTWADVEALARSHAAAGAHLKIVKLGGIAPLLRAARVLSEAGIELMVGQMNEGALATAAAMHCTMVVQPRHAELYGADGLIDDPATGLDYRDGCVHLARGPGLGITLDSQRLVLLCEMTA